MALIAEVNFDDANYLGGKAGFYLE